MPARHLLLVVLLVMLVLCAMAGGLAFMVDLDDHLAQIIYLVAATLAGICLILLLSFLLAHPCLRPCATVSIIVVALAWISVLAAIWSMSSDAPDWLSLENALPTLAFTLGVGVPAILVSLLAGLPWATLAVRLFWIIAAFSWIICELGIFLRILEMPTSGTSSEFLARFTIADGLIVYGIGTCICALFVNFGRKDRRYFRWPGIGIAILAMILAVYFNGFAADFHPLLHGLMVLTLALAIVLAQLNLLLMAKLQGAQEWLRVGSLAAAILAALAAVIFDFVPRDIPSWEFAWQMLLRCSVAAGIAAASATLAVFAVGMLNRLHATALAPSAIETQHIQITCPRCQSLQTLPLGHSVCPKCDLQFDVTVTEPRCPACGYLLYGSHSSHCPECGAKVREPRPVSV